MSRFEAELDARIRLQNEMVESKKDTNPSDDDSLDDIHRRLQESDAANLTAEPDTPNAWDRVKLARHPNRPYTLDYIELLFKDFFEIHGDRRFGDDPAMVAGFALFHEEPCVVIGHQKGRTTRQRQHRNFGMPKPEGYRKALRVMKLAEKFHRPVFTLIDTPGAYPGIDAEERGQAEAIAYNLREMAKLRVPVIVAVTGEGGSGGALAIGMGDRVLMLENSIYSVISPESCSAILWRDQAHAEDAARALRLTAPDLLEFGLIDQIVPEPVGGAHINHQEAGSLLDASLSDALRSVRDLDCDERISRRYEKFRKMGEFEERRESGF
ncbi:MAG TPA: acetyl-CoA carboxylase carboxyltransferase subunit alpha [Blastocatellia bacterium]|nr:acetyl-CoA carboxylase carboxyltransferase subunit alpha [Blastocatellia bacterium]